MEPPDGDPGVVAHEVEAAVPGDGVPDEVAHRRRVGHVEPHSGGAAQLAGDLLGLGAVEVGDDDVAAPGGEPRGDGPADARGPARDDADPRVEVAPGGHPDRAVSGRAGTGSPSTGLTPDDDRVRERARGGASYDEVTTGKL